MIDTRQAIKGSAIIIITNNEMIKEHFGGGLTIYVAIASINRTSLFAFQKAKQTS